MSLPRAPRRILVICIRRLGDVLLSTALVRSLKRAWPDARIDVLVNAGAAVTLQGNPDIAGLIVQPEGGGGFLRIAARIFRRYDLSISTLPNDRTHFFAFLASARRANLISHHPNATGRWWKTRLATWPIVMDASTNHTAVHYLRVADALGIPRVPEVVPPRPPQGTSLDEVLGADWRAAPRAVVHPTPMYPYKALPDATWRRVIEELLSRGLRVYLTGGPAPAERAHVAALASLFPAERVRDVSGRLQFAELTPLIEGCAAFVGPDTSVTHLAAATSVPTLTMFGPSNPVTWGPWPQGHAGTELSPWVKQKPLQHKGNVWLLQGLPPCVPCLLEGCERRRDSRSTCLDEMPPARIAAVLAEMLGPR